MKNTKIPWCDSTWNPVTGCRHNCPYCYARGIANRFKGVYLDGYEIDCDELRVQTGDGKDMYVINEQLHRKTKKGEFVKASYPFGFEPTLHRYLLNQPQSWKEPQTVFVGSMCDLFGSWVPDEWIEEVFKACAAAPQHRYLFLTKNPGRYLQLIDEGKLPLEHWYGETNTQGELWGLPKPYKHFVSVEPIMGEVRLSPLTNVGWIIAGAETGNRKGKVIPTARMVNSLLNECDGYAGYKGNSKIAVFMKDTLLPIMGNGKMRREFPWQ